MENILKSNIRIKHYFVELIEIPFTNPVHLPFGTITTRPSAWLTIEAEVDNKVVRGAAEGTSLPIQIPMYDDYSGNLQQNISRILTSLTNNKLTVSETINRINSVDLGGNFATARMTVEATILDAVARSYKRSVVSYLDNKPSSAVRYIPYGKSITEKDRNSIISAANNAVKDGAKRLKFKVSPENCYTLLSSLRQIQKMYPNIDCMVDANGMFDPENETHIHMLHLIDELNLLTIEEPVSRTGRVLGLDAHRSLAQKLKLQTPITVDDAIKSLKDAKTTLSEGLADIINLKPGRIGSFVKCVEIANYAKSIGKEVMVGGMFEATPGRMMTLSLAAYCLTLNFKIPGDVSLPQERLISDITTQQLHLNDDYSVIFKPTHGWGYSI